MEMSAATHHLPDAGPPGSPEDGPTGRRALEAGEGRGDGDDGSPGESTGEGTIGAVLVPGEKPRCWSEGECIVCMYRPYEGPNSPTQNDRKFALFDRKLEVLIKTTS